jgi:LytS/YehU family sensor histidine kinase
MINLFIGFIISVLLRYRLKKINFLEYSFISLAIIIFVSSFICSALWSLSSIVATESLINNKITLGNITVWEIVVGIVRNNAVFIGWSGLYFGIKFWMEWVSQKEKTDNALLLARNAQFEMLRYQLNPHFLFNTLSSIRALISEENLKAREIITKISEFLRYTLIDNENNEVSLSREIEVIKNYLDIEKVRFEDELIVTFNIDERAGDFPVPIFLIHPLVENAIKHGMQTSPIPLKIVITALIEDGWLSISVFNTGKWRENLNRNYEGRGLENIKRRLEIYCPGRYTFDMVKNEDSVEIKMSFKKN